MNELPIDRRAVELEIVVLTVGSPVQLVLSRDLRDEHVEGQRALVPVVVAELAVEEHLAVVVADCKEGGKEEKRGEIYYYCVA